MTKTPAQKACDTKRRDRLDREDYIRDTRRLTHVPERADFARRHGQRALDALLRAK